MATVHEITTARKTATRHYAHLGDVEGIATFVQGGYLFTADATGERRLVAYNSPDLLLHGYITDEPEQLPLWQRIASPDWYNGSDRRGELAGGR